MLCDFTEGRELYMKMTFNSALKTFLSYTSTFVVLNIYNLLAENLSIFPDSSMSYHKTTAPLRQLCLNQLAILTCFTKQNKNSMMTVARFVSMYTCKC